MKILMIDDDIHKANNLLYCFSDDDIKLSNNFMDGLEKLMAENFELLILDMNFPITENGKIHKLGFEFLNEMKRKKMLIPTVIYSSELYDVANYKNVIGYIKYNMLSDEREHINNIKSKVLSLNKYNN